MMGRKSGRLVAVAGAIALIGGVPVARACLGESTVGPEGAGTGLDAVFAQLGTTAIPDMDTAVT